MGIDIYAKWHNQREEVKTAHNAARLSALENWKGYLWEADHDNLYATEFLCAEAFETGEANIPAEILNERLAHTLELVEERERKIYQL